MTLDPQAMARAKAEALNARQKLDAIKIATQLNQIIGLWSEFLTAHQRSFTRLRKATEKGPSKGWFDNILKLRKEDNLLQYLHHARNADEHGILDITKRREGTVGIKPKIGNSISVDFLGINDKGQVILGPEAAKNTEVLFIPGVVELNKVLDRSIWYDPPNNHLGKDIGDRSIAGIAELAISYIEALIKEAEDRFA